MKNLILSLAIIFAFNNVISAEICSIQNENKFVLQLEDFEGESFSPENEQLINECINKWRVQNHNIKIKKLHSGNQDWPLVSYWANGCEYYFINEDFFNSLTIGQKRACLAFVLVSKWKQFCNKKFSSNNTWFDSILNIILVSSVHYCLQSNGNITDNLAKRFSLSCMLSLATLLTKRIIIDLPLSIWKSNSGPTLDDPGLKLDRELAENSPDYQSSSWYASHNYNHSKSLIDFFEKLRIELESLMEQDVFRSQEELNLLSARIEKLEKLKQKA